MGSHAKNSFNPLVDNRLSAVLGKFRADTFNFLWNSFRNARNISDVEIVFHPKNNEIMAQSLHVKIDQIGSPPFKLRPVRQDTIEFLELVDSIKENGVLNSILVRPAGDGYQLVDGNWRLTACKWLQMDTIPCIVDDFTDLDILRAQLQTNSIRPKTHRAEFAKHLKQLISDNPSITLGNLSQSIHKSATWVSDTLKLADLTDLCYQAIVRGDVPVTSGIALGSLPRRLQDDFLIDAMEMKVEAFVARVEVWRKEYREALAQLASKQKSEGKHQYKAYQRRISEVKKAIDNPKMLDTIVVENKCRSRKDAVRAALQWTINVDRISKAYRLEGIKKREAEAETKKKLRKDSPRKPKQGT